MNFTGGIAGQDDVDVLVLEHSDYWLYEVKIRNHPVYGEHPYRSSTKHTTRTEALAAGQLQAEKLLLAK